MRDVARQAGGLHPSTVSLALRNDVSISEGTRKRIWSIAKQLGYRRDPRLDAYNAHRIELLPHKSPAPIAFVAEFESARTMEASPQHMALWNGARAAAEALHCQLDFFPLAAGKMTSKRLDAVLGARGIGGVIVAALSARASQPEFQWHRYCAVKVESLHFDVPLFTVSADFQQAGRLTLRKAREAGYIRVGLLLGSPEKTTRNDLLRTGFLYEQAHLSPSAKVPPFDEKSGLSASAIKSWVHLYGIDAVITDRQDIEEALNAAKLLVSADFGWACLNLCGASPEIAGAAVDHERIGALAVEQVVNLVRANQLGPPESASWTLVPFIWKNGPSLPGREHL